MKRFTFRSDFRRSRGGPGNNNGGGGGGPKFTSAATANVAENVALSHTLTATQNPTFSIVGGADQALFEISGSTLRFLSNGTKDFENPNDADTNNTYVVTVRATKGVRTADQTITITVTNVADALAATYIGELADNADGTCSGTLNVGATAGTVVLAIRVVRSSANQSVIRATINGSSECIIAKHSTSAPIVAALAFKTTTDSGSIAMSARTNASANTITASVYIITNIVTVAPADSAVVGPSDNPTLNIDYVDQGCSISSGVSAGSGTAHTWTGTTEDVETLMGSFGTGGAAHTNIAATEANRAISLSSGAGTESIASLAWSQAALGSRDLTFLANSILLSCDGVDAATTLTDDSQFAHTPTFAGNAQIDTAQSVFGTASLLFDGTGDYVSFPNHPAFQLYDLDFDIQLRARFAVNTTLQSLITFYNAGTNNRSWALNYRGDLATDILQFVYSTAGTSGTTLTVDSSAWTPTTNTWYALRVNRKGGTLRIWVDGVMKAKSTVTAAFFISTATLMIGGQDLTTGTMNGWIDEVRVKKGYTDYDSDSNYTVESAVFSRT